MSRRSARISFRYHGREIHVATGKASPKEVYLNQFFKLNGVLCMVVGIRPEDGYQTLVVDVVTCSPKYMLKTALELHRRNPTY